jgi:hypothetical protein
MVGLEYASVDMIRDVGNKWLMVLWEWGFMMGWVVCGKQRVEKTVEFALTYVTDVADRHTAVNTIRTGLP